MADCPDIQKTLVPLSRAVAAAMIDTFADKGNSQQVYSHWGAREVAKLQQQVLKRGKRTQLLTVNANTRTATLPPDFKSELFVGYINSKGEKIPIPINSKITTPNAIEEIECEDKCPKCNQNSSICNDLTVTESVETVIINAGKSCTTWNLYGNIVGSVKFSYVTCDGTVVTSQSVSDVGIEVCIDDSYPITMDGDGIKTAGAACSTAIAGFYDKTTIKKLYPNGDYYLEVTTPYFNADNGLVEYITTKEFIVAISLKPCGCPENTEENIAIIQDCCYDAWCCHYAPCSSVCDTNAGGYRIFEESGLIQFDFNFKYTQVYLEYLGFIPKLNGQLAIPEVAFESVVAGIKFRSVENKKSVPLSERAWYWQRYVTERGNMQKILGRVSLADIINSINLNPKFDFELPFNCYSGVCNTIAVVSSSSADCAVASSSGSTGNTINNTINETINNIVNNTITYIINNYTEIKIIVDGLSGSPVALSNTYQNNALIGATGLAAINVNKNTEYVGEDYTFNGVTGTITRVNQWQTGDIAVLDFTRLGNGTVNTPVALTDGATVTWSFSSGNVGYFTIGGNRTLAITNITENTAGVLYVTQDGTGSRTLTFPSGSLFINGWNGVLPATAGAVIPLAFFYDGTNYRWNLG